MNKVQSNVNKAHSGQYKLETEQKTETNQRNFIAKGTAKNTTSTKNNPTSVKQQRFMPIENKPKTQSKGIASSFIERASAIIDQAETMKINNAIRQVFDSKNLSYKDKKLTCKALNIYVAKKCMAKNIYVDDLVEDCNKQISMFKHNSDNIKFISGIASNILHLNMLSKMKGTGNNELYDELITRKIICDINAKNDLGISTTGKDIESHINMINKDNVISILNKYKNILRSDNKAEIIMDIIRERGLKYEKREKLTNHIVDALGEKAKDMGKQDVDILLNNIKIELSTQGKLVGYADEKLIASRINTLIGRIGSAFNYFESPNGKIDSEFGQSNVTGDCWLLASINALLMTPKGNRILNNSIKVNEEKQTVTVKLKGPNKSYRFHFDELAAAGELASGDGDVRALEMAVNQYFEEEHYVNDKPDINGNRMRVAYEILTGKSGWNHIYNEGSPLDKWINGDIAITDEKIDNFNKKNHVACVSSHGNKMKINALQSDGQIVDLVQNHAYAVVNSDSKYVYIINPWFSGKTIILTREKFKDFFNNIEAFDL